MKKNILIISLVLFLQNYAIAEEILQYFTPTPDCLKAHYKKMDDDYLNKLWNFEPRNSDLIITSQILRETITITPAYSKNCSSDALYSTINQCLTAKKECHCRDEIYYPVISGNLSDEALDKINRKITQIAKQETKYCNARGTGLFLLRHKVLQETPKVITVIFLHYNYGSDAFGGGYATALNFDVKTGSEIKLDDIKNYTNESELRKYVLQELRHNDKSYYYHKYLPNEPHYDKVDALKNLNHRSFYFKKDSIVFMFKPNEVGSGTAGIIEVEVPKGLITQQYFK